VSKGTMEAGWHKYLTKRDGYIAFIASRLNNRRKIHVETVITTFYATIIP